MKKAKFNLIIVTIALVIAIIGILYFLPRNLEKDEIKDELTPSIEKVDKSNGETKEIEEIEENTEKASKTGNNTNNLPKSKQIKAVFVPQAPFKEWSEPWQNACEEASLLTLHYYLEGISEVTPEEVKSDIEKMLSFEDRYFGSHKDLKMSEVGMVAEEYLGYKNVRVEYDININDIKKEITAGNLVFLPIAGHILDNPHFTDPPPAYHTLVVTGYDTEKIITNDPGTQHGENLEYTYENLYDSIHDFVDGADKNPDLMLRGRKAMLVIEK